ncbi:MAG: DmsC/YnfH family molybdoenzyme membrane anchor subunit [Betaproteobacteria bacterium]
MSYGPNPRQQASWDWRAAANFIGGGSGSGLVVFAAFADVRGGAGQLLLAAGLTLIALGLLCVWLEIGRPWRALNVFSNWRRSWMSREAIVGVLLFAAGAMVAADVMASWWVVALLAFVFAYCQARILRAAKGIPAWREPWLTPYLLVTAVTEGAGLFWLCASQYRAATLPLLAALGVFVVVRLMAWLAYRRHLRGAAPVALAALDGVGRLLQLWGTAIPLALVVIAMSGVVVGPVMFTIAAVAGLCAVVAGAWTKWTLITQAGFNQGFALAHLPVRGVRPAGY